MRCTREWRDECEGGRREHPRLRAPCEELPQHVAAYARLTELAEGDAFWGILVFCVGEFVRGVTHPRLFDPPYTVDAACLALERVLESPSLRILCPGERYWPLFAEAPAGG